MQLRSAESLVGPEGSRCLPVEAGFGQDASVPLHLALYPPIDQTGFPIYLSQGSFLVLSGLKQKVQGFLRPRKLHNIIAIAFC